VTDVPPAFVVLAVALLIPFLPRRVGHALGFAAVGAVAPWSWLVRTSPGAHFETTFASFDVVLLNVDTFSILMGVLFGAFGAAAVAYSAYTEAPKVQTAFAVSYVGTSLGAVFAGDWLSLIFFWELMAVTSTALVWYYGGKAVRAGFRYALFHGVGGSLLMVAVVLEYVNGGGGTSGFLFTGDGFSGFAAVLAALGIGVNVGFIGLHAWLPDTYPRPHVGASVFLCAFTTKAGVYVAYRAFPDGSTALAYMGGAMAVYGVVFALVQNDMRRLLSYHIQAQVGYMLAGVGLGGSLAVAGGFAHVFNHVLYKGLLFMGAGTVVYRTGENSLKKVSGMRHTMPVTFVAFTVAALSISAFPGFNGFVSKGMIVDAAHEMEKSYALFGEDILWWLLILGGVGTFMSFIKFEYYAFLGDEATHDVRDANLGQKAVMLSVAGACVLLGLFPEVLFSLLPDAGKDLHPYSTSHITEGLGLAVAGVVGFYASKPLLKRVGHLPDVDAVYNPVVFYGTRAVVRGTTDAFAAVNRVVVRLAKGAVGVVNDPAGAVVRNVPESLRLRYEERRAETPGETGTRLGIGESILVVSAVLAVAIFVSML